MLKLLTAFKSGIFDLTSGYKQSLDKHIDDYHTLKSMSLMDNTTGSRMYIVDSYGPMTEKKNHSTFICMSTAHNHFPRVDYMAFTSDDGVDYKNVFVIIPEEIYRDMTWIEKHAILAFLITEVSFIRMECCLFEEDKHIIDTLCKPIPNFLAGRVNKFIDWRVGVYNSFKKEIGGIPQIYQTPIDYKNIKRETEK